MICLQGGAEFGADGAAMDLLLLVAAAQVPGGGAVVVSALAGAEGREHDTANANGVRHFSALAAASDDAAVRALEVVAAPDARRDRGGALEAMSSAALLVLPGGSPSRLLSTLRGTGADDAVLAVLDRGGVVMGASAGAMVLCALTWLPDRRSVVEGLDLVPDHLVLPHWSPGGRERLRGSTGADAVGPVLGLPEQSGVLVADGTITAVGHRPSVVVDQDGAERTVPLGGSVPLRP